MSRAKVATTYNRLAGEKIDIQSFSLTIELKTIRKSWKTRIKMLYVDFSFTLFTFETKGKQDPTKTKIDPDPRKNN